MTETNASASSINADIAAKLDEMAALLEQQGEDGFRIRAYRQAAQTLRDLAEAADVILQRDGPDGLIALPHVGRRIGAAIAEMVTTGRWIQLERTAGALDPIHLFQTLPGVGPQLAERIHDELGVDTLEALEVAAHDGRLAGVPGMGERRCAVIRAVLNERLGRRRIRPRSVPGPAPGGVRASEAGERFSMAPDVAALLAVDAEYRSKAQAGELHRIAPRRFNPDRRAWLPILHTRRGDWDFTALFSNTARAHQLGRTQDWVVIYAQRHGDESPETQWTVVTETQGPQAGRRVVRGRESECANV